MPSAEGEGQGPRSGTLTRPWGPRDSRRAELLEPRAGPIRELPGQGDARRPGSRLAPSAGGAGPRPSPPLPPPPLRSPLQPAAAPEVTRPRPSILCPSVFNEHNRTGSRCRPALPPDRRAQEPVRSQNSRAFRSPSTAASAGGARAASKLSGAAVDVSQQRSREANGPRRLAMLAGQGGGVTTAAWGSLCDTITTTLCWCRGSLCLQQIPPVSPAPCAPAAPAVLARGCPSPAPAM